MNITEIIKTEQEKKKREETIKKTFEFRRKMVNEDFDEFKKIYEERRNKILKQFNFDMEENMKELDDELIIDCHHSIIIKSHDSMLCSSSPELMPNENHISYYCLACGCQIPEKDIPKDSIIIDFFGHDDALEVGKDHYKALIDYSRQIAVDLLNYNPDFTDEEIADCIKNGFKNVPIEYIKKY